MMYLFSLKYLNGNFTVRSKSIFTLNSIIPDNIVLVNSYMVVAFFIKESVLIYSFILFFCKFFFNYWFTLGMFLDDWECRIFEVISCLYVLVNLIHVSFAC